MASALQCPRCRAEILETVRANGRRVERCRRCGGLWCEPTDWDRELLGEFPSAESGGGEASDIRVVQPSQMSCPACRAPMRELRVSGPRELTLDQCGRCGGVWFDHSEWDCLEALREWQHFRERDGRPTTWAEWFFQFLFNLPVEMNVRPQRPAYVTQAIIVACVAVFIVGLGDDLTPLFALTGDRALTLAGLPTFITHQFLHATPVHLLGNMYFLYVTGDNVEDVLGHVRFLCFYLLAGVLAGAAFLFITSPDPAFPLVGASGSISAVMAAYALLFRQAKLTVMVFFQQFRVPAWAWIGFWFAFNVLGAVTDPTGQRTHIAFIAHLMGFAVGIALVAPRRRRLIDGHPLLGLLASDRLG